MIWAWVWFTAWVLAEWQVIVLLRKPKHTTWDMIIEGSGA